MMMCLESEMGVRLSLSTFGWGIRQADITSRLAIHIGFLQTSGGMASLFGCEMTVCVCVVCVRVHVHVCLQPPSNRRFYRQIASYKMSVGDDTLMIKGVMGKQNVHHIMMYVWQLFF